MKKLTRFEEYLLTKINEEMGLRIKEVELVLSPKLIKTLREMNHQIADDLLSKHYESDEAEFKATFVDLGSDPGKVSYIMANKVPELVEPDIVHGDYHREEPDTDEVGKKVFKGGYYDYIQMYKNPWISDINHVISLHDQQFKSKEHPVWKKHRVENTAIRFIKLLFPNKYKLNVTRDELSKQDKPSDLESFQNMFKAIVEANSKIIVKVNGDDIIKYYNRDNYQISSGNLGGSCMNDPSKGKYLKMYSLNPNNVEMLVLYPEDVRDKIIGRALLWKLPNGKFFMDRVYVAKDSDEYMFVEYAKAKGYLYKTSQTYGWDYDLIDGKTGKRERYNIEVKLENTDFEYYPYLDTLQYFNKETGVLTNNGLNIERDKGWLLCTDTTGDASPI
ncbi:MAG: hypothetical protein ACOC2W_04960 [bacterium]